METRNKINQQAWDILNNDEKTALSLSLGHGKSTWESGEIMSKAHFKYLEIQKRAKKFLEIFTNHLEKYGGLFPVNLNLSFAFKEYLILTIIERKNISSSIHQMEDNSYRIANKRSNLIINEIRRLQATNTQEAMDLYSVIMDFDRWNNFRILPLEIQEPSAFKRRNKARNVKHLKNITTLPQFSVMKLIEKYSYKGKYKKLYLPIISEYLEKYYKVISIRDTNTTIKEISDIGLFLFDGQAIAMEFAKLISGYFVRFNKNCKTGQKFWPEFRILMAKAVNYKELENIHKSRSYLENAFFDREKLRMRKKLTGSEKRVEDEKLFYPDIKK